MKKILIVFTNARVGGIQKALISYLKEMREKADITLLLFHKYGKLLHQIPKGINVIEEQSDYKYMGMTQSDCHTVKDKLKRGIYALVCKLFGERIVVWLISRTVKDQNEIEYDEAISFIHVTYMHSLYGGVPQYVLNLQKVKKKICFVHCDYLNSGTRTAYSDSIYKRFDEIVCVSESTKKLFLEAIPQMEGKVCFQYNPVDKEDIKRQSEENPYEYDSSYINCLTIARLSPGKGIVRVIEAIHNIGSSKIKYYIVGEGIERETIEKKIKEYGLSETITLFGEQENPYRYLKNADLMIVPSYHEAAPVVFQEAIELGVPVFTTRTSSADEMVGEEYGIVVENDDLAIENELRIIIDNPKCIIKRYKVTNNLQ